MTHTIEALQRRINQRIETSITQDYLNIQQVSPPLVEAMTYSLKSTGKRIRPLLVYASAIATGGNLDLADHCATAIEMIHTYSLIHDDLPAMDDDDMRRGQPSCHIQHGEAIAILAGDALQALAFDQLIMAANTAQPGQLIQLIAIINKASIAMVSGQALDVSSVNLAIDEHTLRIMHTNKTGALISASVVAGSLCNCQADNGHIDSMKRVGDVLGLAFQIQDDLLDLEQETDALGKPQGSDVARNKPTYPAVLGIHQSKELERSLHQQAIEILNTCAPESDTRLLRELCIMLSHRKS